MILEEGGGGGYERGTPELARREAHKMWSGSGDDSSSLNCRLESHKEGEQSERSDDRARPSSGISGIRLVLHFVPLE